MNNTEDIECKISDVFGKGFAVEKNEDDYHIKSKALFNKYKLMIRVMSERYKPRILCQ